MRPSTVYHVFLISWIHCIVVIVFSVTMTTQSTDGAAANGIFNSSGGNESQNVKSLETFLSKFAVPCPPQNSLQFVCDNSLGDPGSTCDDRALIIDKCLHQFPGLYNNSPWSLCLMDVNQCETVLNVLRINGFINKTIDDGISVTVTSFTVSTTLPVRTTTLSISNATSKSVTTSSSISGIPASSTPKVTPDSSNTTNVSISNATSKSVTISIISGIPASSTSKATLDSSDTSNVTPMDEGMKTQSSGDEFPPDISYIYPIIGAFLIAFEIVVLCIFSCNKKKREQNATSGSLVLHEEVIEPETASPTKAALHPNSIYDEDTVLSEDKTIYKSYINLKYIDDTSAESTPEKALIRT